MARLTFASDTLFFCIFLVGAWRVHLMFLGQIGLRTNRKSTCPLSVHTQGSAGQSGLPYFYFRIAMPTDLSGSVSQDTLPLIRERLW